MIHILLFILAAATTPRGTSNFVETRTITGLVVAETGEPLIFCNIVAYDNDHKLLTGTQTDLDGQFSIDVPTECRWLEASYTGFETTRIEIGDSSHYVITLKGGTVLDAVVITEYLVPLVEHDNTTSGGIERVRNLPTKNINAIAATTAGLSSVDGGDISIRGSRKGSTSFYLDGIRVSKSIRGTSRESRAAIKSRIKADEADHVNIQDGYSAGQLTAGEINDFGKWTLWNDKSQDELTAYRTFWKMYPSKRYAVILQNENGMPIIGQAVCLSDEENCIVWEARTDNTGKAELWANMFEKTVGECDGLTITAAIAGKEYSISNVKAFEEGVNHMTIMTDCVLSNVVEAVFVVDATGSMGDELHYLQAELMDVIQKVKENHQDLELNLGCVFYRDHGDAYITRTSELSNDISKTVSFIQYQTANGGGDHEEAVDEALDVAVSKMNWTVNARTKLLFLVADAPPHQDDEHLDRMRRATREAAKAGIKIIPLAASGIGKSTEYLMRSLALCTNGTYVFLTDHSGIGNPHLEPTTDQYEYEKLNDLLIRLFDQNCAAVSCFPSGKRLAKHNSDTWEIESVGTVMEDSLSAQLKDGKDLITEKINCKYYPNPTSGLMSIELEGQVQEIFLCDVSGKLLQKIDTRSERKFQIDISQYPSGTYGILYFDGSQKPRSGVVLLVK